MDIVLLSALVVAASSVGTITGFGTSTLMVPVLVPFYGLSATLLLVGIVHWFGNVWKVWLFRRGMRWKLILQFAVVGIPATLLGSSLAIQVDEQVLSRVLGAMLALYVVFLLRKSDFQIPRNTPSTLAGGAVYGFSAGVFGIGGAIRGAVLTSYNLSKSVYITTTGAIGLLVDSGRIAAYLAGGIHLDPRLWWGMLAFVPASLLGARLGKSVVNRIPEARFRQVIAVALVIVSIKLLFFP